MQMQCAGQGGSASAFGELMQCLGEAADGAGNLGFAHLDDVIEHFAKNFHGVG